MHGEDELGISGHASHVEQVREFQRTLSMLGLRYEAEGDTTRIHMDGLLVEVKDLPGGGVVIEAMLPLPASTGDDPGFYSSSAERLFKLMREMGEGLGVEYSIDEAAPGYPVLRATIRVGGLEEAYTLLDSALRSLLLA
ncbi:MAG: hypothetical protein F7C08_03095 [Desulfurococcales archaeon]|nr:hypothetical protein [Desulfurococcales archaeon]MCE4605500.1 hypothetical protein [Desulfurococcales archaeon]